MSEKVKLGNMEAALKDVAIKALAKTMSEALAKIAEAFQPYMGFAQPGQGISQQEFDAFNDAVAGAVVYCLRLRQTYHYSYATEYQAAGPDQLERLLREKLPKAVIDDIVGVEVSKFLAKVAEVEAIANQAAETAEQARQG